MENFERHIVGEVVREYRLVTNSSQLGGAEDRAEL